MTEQDRAHAKAIARWFVAEMTYKYSMGVQQHGGHLPAKGGLLAEAEAEVLDMAVYVRTLRDQLDRIYAALQAGRVDDATASLGALLNGTPEYRLLV